MCSAGLKFFGALGWIELWGPVPIPRSFPPIAPYPTGGGTFTFPLKGGRIFYSFGDTEAKEDWGHFTPLAGIMVNF